MEDVEGETHPSIWGQLQRLRCCDEGPEDLVTFTTGALAEKDKPKVSTMATEALAEEYEATTRPRERLQRRRRWWCHYELGELTLTMAALLHIPPLLRLTHT